MAFPTKTYRKLHFAKVSVSYIAGKQSKLSYDQIQELVINILNETLSLTLADLNEWIDEKVPKRTGKLRKDLKLEIKSSFVSRMLLRLKLGTHISYAEFVNNMMTSQVAHEGEWGTAYYGGYHGKIFLNDPNAVGWFFVQMIEYAKKRLEVNFIKAKAINLSGKGVGGKMISNKFKWGV